MKKLLFCLMLSFFFLSNTSISQSGWTVQNSGTSYHICEIFFFDFNTGFAAGGNENGSIILKTINGGNTWSINYQSTNPAFISIKFLNSNTGYAVGGRYPTSVIMKTTNQGQNWINQYNPTTGSIFSVSIIDADTAYCAAGYGCILKTTNGGTNWVIQQTAITDHFEYVQFLNSHTGYAAARGGQIMKTTNSGNNWFMSYNCGIWLISENFINYNTGYVVGRNGIILFTSNGGTNWSSQLSGTNNYLNEVLFVNQNTGFIIGDTGKVLKTTNAGINWTSRSSATNNNLLSIFFLNDNTGYACGQFGAIMKTTSGGIGFIVPTLVYPPNNSTNNPLTPSLTWMSSSPALYYKVQVSSLMDFSVIVDSATLTTTQRTVPAGKLNPSTTYFWRVSATNSVGTGPWSEVWSFGTTTSGIKLISSEIPEKNFLYNNYPNPFNPSTNIKYQISRSSFVSLKVFDLLGREVETLVSEKQSPGTYEVKFENNHLQSGIYFYKMQVGEFSKVMKMVLVK